MPDCNLLGVFQSAVGPVVAVLVAVCVQIGLVLRSEKRRVRRALAEAVDQCCDMMEEVAILYWTDGNPSAEILVGKMNAALIKVNRLVSESRCIGRNEADRLRAYLKVLRKNLARDFGVTSRRVDQERMILVVGMVLSIRCEAAKLRG